jgi:plastocyanin
MKFLFIIAIVAVVMIGTMIPISIGQNQDRVFIETVDEAGFDFSCHVLGCYTPAIVIVSVGDVVTMTNMDSTVHSFTSGGERSSVENAFGYFPKIGDGVFDSGILLPKKNFEWIPENAGRQPYYCVVHSHMTGMIIVNDPNKTVPSNPTTTTIEPTVELKPKKLGIASFVDQSKDPQHYIDRYNNESIYKEWFDENYSQYISIYQAVGMKEPISTYLEKPIVEVLPTLNCGIGTIEKNGICVAETKVVEKELVKLETNSKLESKENLIKFCTILMMLVVPGIMIVLYVIILWKMNSDYISRVFAALILFGIFFVIWIALVFGVLSSCM